MYFTIYYSIMKRIMLEKGSEGNNPKLENRSTPSPMHCPLRYVCFTLALTLPSPPGRGYTCWPFERQDGEISGTITRTSKGRRWLSRLLWEEVRTYCYGCI